MNFKKVVRLGYAGHRVGSVYCKIEHVNGRLSISGVEGPMSGGECKGSCGQIVMGYAEPGLVEQIKPAPGWSHDKIREFFRLWDRWHLNDMRAGCEHQREAGWDKRPIDPSKPTSAYGKHYPGQRHASWNMLVLVDRSEHPEGLLSRPCLVCGYRYGSAWLREEVPEDVLAWLRALPDADRKPAWV